MKALSSAIAKLNNSGSDVGLNSALELPLLSPAGQGHFIQWLIPKISQELEELEDYDQNHFFLLDLLEATGLEFILDESGNFASIQSGDVSALLDLRDPNLHLLYCFTNVKEALNLIKNLVDTEVYFAKRLFSRHLHEAAAQLEQITEFQYLFEEMPLKAAHTTSLKGNAKGGLASDLFFTLQKLNQKHFNLTQVTGLTTTGGVAQVRFRNSGFVEGYDIRLVDFLKALGLVQSRLQAMCQKISESHIFNLTDTGEGLSLTGKTLEVAFLSVQAKHSSHPLPQIPEVLLKNLTTGIKPLELWGSYRLIARNQWKILASDPVTNLNVEMELHGAGLRFYLKDKVTLALVEKILCFVAQSVSAWGFLDD